MSRVLGYAVAAFGAGVMLCSGYHASYSVDLENSSWLARSRVVDQLRDSKVSENNITKVSDEMKSLEMAAKHQKNNGLLGAILGLTCTVAGFGITRHPS